MQADDLDHVEEEGGDDEEESEEEEEEELVEMLSKNLPKRRSRGTRMRSLMDQEQEADNAFWGQKAWDEGSDDDYEHVSEKDSEDPDIDQAEVDDGEYGDASLGKQRRTKAKAGAYQDPAAARRGRKAGAPRGARAAGGRAPRIPVERVARSFRKTTQNRSSVAKTAREADAAERVKQRKARPARKVVVEFQMTQEDLLREAAQTEVENRRSLGTMLQVEEENSKSGAPGSKVLMVRFFKNSNKKQVWLATSALPQPYMSAVMLKPKLMRCVGFLIALPMCKPQYLHGKASLLSAAFAMMRQD